VPGAEPDMVWQEDGIWRGDVPSGPTPRALVGTAWPGVLPRVVGPLCGGKAKHQVRVIDQPADSASAILTSSLGSRTPNGSSTVSKWTRFHRFQLRQKHHSIPASGRKHVKTYAPGDHGH
jgi:hypothetical protein